MVYGELVHVKVHHKTILVNLDKFVKCTLFYDFFKSFDVGAYTFLEFLS
jgi:hypothetical protein